MYCLIQSDNWIKDMLIYVNVNLKPKVIWMCLVKRLHWFWDDGTDAKFLVISQ